MERRKLGNSGIETAPLALGGNVFGWTADEPTSFKLLDAFIDAGFSFIDTADIYSRWAPGNSGGESEAIIGKWLKRGASRQKAVIATKVGMEMGPEKKGLSKAYILSEVEESLRRLQTDYIDLYQSHADDQSTPIEETLEAYGSLIKQGKVRAIGASNYTGPRLLQALQASDAKGLPRYESLQPLYNLYDRADYETNLEPVCVANHLGVISYYSLASGFLTGKYRSTADAANVNRGQVVKKYLDDRGFRILKALDKLAGDYRSTPAKIALAWLMARPSITAPIASATSLDQLNELVDSTRLKLDPTAIQYLNDASRYSSEASAR
ncbi:MAG: aldo/keto reductase [Bryobacteraceae bacterium]